jgi:hypothetical protein
MLKYLQHQLKTKKLMTLFPYLQLQTIDPQEDGTVSDLDMYEQDETIDLSSDTDGETLERSWSEITKSLHEEE